MNPEIKHFTPPSPEHMPFAYVLYSRVKQFLAEEQLADLTRTEDMAIAFLIESLRDASEAKWEASSMELIEELRTTSQSNGVATLTLLLAEKIHCALIAALNVKKNNPALEVATQTIDALSTQLASTLETRRDIAREGRRTPLGSIPIELVPQWFTLAP